MVTTHNLVVLHEDKGEDGEGQPHLPILLVTPSFIGHYIVSRDLDTR